MLSNDELAHSAVYSPELSRRATAVMQLVERAERMEKALQKIHAEALNVGAGESRQLDRIDEYATAALAELKVTP